MKSICMIVLVTDFPVICPKVLIIRMLIIFKIFVKLSKVSYHYCYSCYFSSNVYLFIRLSHVALGWKDDKLSIIGHSYGAMLGMVVSWENKNFFHNMMYWSSFFIWLVRSQLSESNIMHGGDWCSSTSSRLFGCVLANDRNTFRYKSKSFKKSIEKLSNWFNDGNRLWIVCLKKNICWKCLSNWINSF